MITAKTTTLEMAKLKAKATTFDGNFDELKKDIIDAMEKSGSSQKTLVAMYRGEQAFVTSFSEDTQEDHEMYMDFIATFIEKENIEYYFIADEARMGTMDKEESERFEKGEFTREDIDKGHDVLCMHGVTRDGQCRMEAMKLYRTESSGTAVDSEPLFKLSGEAEGQVEVNLFQRVVAGKVDYNQFNVGNLLNLVRDQLIGDDIFRDAFATTESALGFKIPEEDKDKIMDRMRSVIIASVATTKPNPSALAEMIPAYVGTFISGYICAKEIGGVMQ